MFNLYLMFPRFSSERDSPKIYSKRVYIIKKTELEFKSETAAVNNESSQKMYYLFIKILLNIN